jgi:enoyl-CoA hydratase/carnithine racemase
MTSHATPPNIESKTEPLLLRERRDSIELLTLNRPRARNSLSEAMLLEISETLDKIGSDKDVRVVVLSASGPAFCAGHDLKELNAHRQDEDNGRAYFENIMTLCSRMMQSIVNLRIPVIAVVHGVATAAGCQLVASCDLAIASSSARFATPGVDIGLFCSTPMVALSRNVSSKQAMEMLLTGEMISADDACRIGLINRVVEAGTELDEALNLAEKIARKSPHAVTTGKQAFYRQKELDLASAYKYTGKLMVENLLAGDAKEGICAFLEKREPQWTE